MQLLSLRSAGRDDETAQETARRFLEALFGGGFEEAEGVAGNDFSWFGQSALDWQGDRIRAFVEVPTSVSSVRAVEPQMVGLIAPEVRSRVLGALGADDRVVLADVTRERRCSTTVVVVDIRKRRVTRVLDALPFREALEAVVEQASA